MRVSHIFGKTLREIPSEADNISHQLLLRTTMIHQEAAGVYTYLPLAWRVLHKIEQIIRKELDTLGAQELMMPALQPFEVWERTGRYLSFGKSLFTLKDRRDRKLCLGPTHEEIITELVHYNLKSYRDLPLLLYQLQIKFRDEPRPRGGLLRAREFTMMDLYSFDRDAEGLDANYHQMIQAYQNIFERCGVSTMMVEADSGAIGGKDSHEFMVITASGEDEILYCSCCSYAANVERAQGIKSPIHHQEPLPLEEVSTPGIKTIEDLAAYLQIPKSQTLKAVFYSADDEIVFVVIRGDLEVNEVKLKNLLKCSELRLAEDTEVEKKGLVAGSASPVKITGIRIIADDSVTQETNLVAGANKPDYHLKNVNYPRDFQVDIITDVATAKVGQGCPRCHSELNSIRGIEVGHIFKLGTIFTEKLGVSFLDQEGRQSLPLMGCYGIGISRLLAAAIEQSHDEKGIIWTMPISPYQVYLCALGLEDNKVVTVAEELYACLMKEGVEILFDDRFESAGVKFNDADLLGIPLRLTISPRALKSQSVELKWRTEKESHLIPLSEATQVIVRDLTQRQDLSPGRPSPARDYEQERFQRGQVQ